MQIYTLFSGYAGSNCYVLTSTDKNGAKHAAVVDPSDSAESINGFIYSQGADLDFIVLTHGHFDHITSLDSLRRITSAPAYIHRDDNEMLGNGIKNASSLLCGYEQRQNEADRLLSDGDVLRLGDEQITVMSVPGHSRGSICLICDKFIVTGDTLFADGYGRYDLYGGDRAALMSSLNRLRELNNELMIYPGHGRSERLGRALDNTLYF